MFFDAGLETDLNFYQETFFTTSTKFYSLEYKEGHMKKSLFVCFEEGQMNIIFIDLYCNPSMIET